MVIYVSPLTNLPRRKLELLTAAKADISRIDSIWSHYTEQKRFITIK
jgi:hypothetical protein